MKTHTKALTKRIIRQHVAPIGISIIFLIPIIFVFFWMISMSLKTQVQINSYPPTMIPQPATTEWYTTLFYRQPFVKYTINSLIVAVSATGIAALLGLPAAYVVAKWRMNGSATIILIMKIIPAISYLIPWFIIAQRTGLSDTLTILAILHLIITLPLITWIMIGFYATVPDEMIDCSRVDGCNAFQTFFFIVTPLVKPGIVAAMILAFIMSWNNFLFSAVLGGSRSQTLPVAVYGMLTFEEANWGPLTAAATIVCLPIIVGSLIFQRHLVQGLTAGAVKG